jgi:hypothetical protein
MYKNVSVEEARKILNDLKVYNLPVKDVEDKLIPGYRVIRRTKDNSPVKILTNKFFITQHIDIFNQTINQLDNYGLNYDIKSIVTNESGRRHSVNITFTFPEIAFDIDGSTTLATFELINANDGNQSISRVFGAYRLKCSNGMFIGETLFEEKRKHYGEGYELEPIDEALDELHNNFNNFGKMIEKSRDIKITKAIQQKLISAGFPRLMVERLPNMANKYISVYHEDIKEWDKLWAAYQALTNWISNVAIEKNLQRAAKLQLDLYSIIQSEINK